MSTAAETLAQAKARHAAGDLRSAQRLYRRALEAEPANAEAHFLLGATCHALGQPNDAIASLTRATQLNPAHAEAHNHLGALLAQQGKLDAAVASFEQASSLLPESAEISKNLRHARAVRDNNLGNALAAQGKPAEAAACYRRALALRSDYPEAHNNLGMALAEQKQVADAVVCFRRALELKPDFAEAHNNLGAELVQRDELNEAAARFQRAIELKPGYAKAHNNLGALFEKQRKLDEATACYRRALELNPDFSKAHINLGAVLAERGYLDDALASCRRGLELAPDDPEAHNNLAAVFEKQGSSDEAVRCCRRALDLKPDFAEAHNNLGLALTQQGRTDEAVASFRRALEIRPQFALAHSNILLTLQYLAGTTLPQLAATHQLFDERHAAMLRTWRRHGNRPDPTRRLRLGFVSPDMGFHPVGYFLIRALENLDRRQAETICYSDRHRADAMTHRLRGAASAWHDTRALDDQQLADQIRADQIDILFDLAGHTANNRLLSFARKPAPVQISWIGYVGTTGLKAMDYLLADRHQLPEAAEPYMTERALRMPDGYVCYDPPTDAPGVSPLPAWERGRVTYGSFNNLAKLTPQVVEAWARILRRVAGARLVLKYRGLDAASVAAHFTRMFAEHGVESSRLELLGGSPHAEFLRQYREIDIALDPFPYSGGLTTCEALWMGVPVVTCPGETFASRHSLSHLSSVGLTQTIAADLNQYVETAVSLAADLPRLAAIRAKLRQQVAASPLCDGQRFGENLMGLLRGAWRQWCDERANASTG